MSWTLYIQMLECFKLKEWRHFRTGGHVLSMECWGVIGFLKQHTGMLHVCSNATPDGLSSGPKCPSGVSLRHKRAVTLTLLICGRHCQDQSHMMDLPHFISPPHTPTRKMTHVSQMLAGKMKFSILARQEESRADFLKKRKKNKQRENRLCSCGFTVCVCAAVAGTNGTHLVSQLWNIQALLEDSMSSCFTVTEIRCTFVQY